MADHLGDLERLAREFIPADEQVLASVDVAYAGKVNLNQSLGGLAALGSADGQVIAGEQLAERLGDHSNVVFPTAKQMALVLTGHRLLVWSRGGLKGKPKAFLGEVPLGAIDSMDHETSRLGRRFEIEMRSGWQLALDAAGTPQVDDFLVQLAARLQRVKGDQA